MFIGLWWTFFSMAQTKYADDDKGINRQAKLSIEEALSKWDNGINDNDGLVVKKAYASKVLYFGALKSDQECADDKAKMAEAAGFSHALSGEVAFTKVSEDKILVNFVKRVGSNAKGINNYGTYMLFERIDGSWKISVESDVIKDKELLAQHKNVSLYYLDPASSTLTGTFKKETQMYTSKSGKQSEVEVYMLVLPIPIQVLPVANVNPQDSATKANLTNITAVSQVEKVELMVSNTKPFDNKEGQNITVKGKIALPPNKNYSTKVVLNDVEFIK